MPLTIKRWSVSLYCRGGYIYLPFDDHFKANDPSFDNRMPLSGIGPDPFWYLSFSFDEMDRNSPDYPRSVELHLNDDFASIKLSALSTAASNNRASGPIPTEVGKYKVRVVLRNKDGAPLLSQSGSIINEPG